MSFKQLKTIREEPAESDPLQPLLSDRDSDQQFLPKEPTVVEQQEDPNKDNAQSFVVGSGMGGLYLDSTFGFEPKDKSKNVKRLTLNQRVTKVFGTKIEIETESADKLFEEIPKYVAWCILFYSAFNNAMMPPWIMNIKAEKYLRISWRFGLQAIFLIPFIMYEYRTGNEKVRSSYTYKYISNWNHMRKLYISSWSTAITFGVSLFCFDYTNISTVFVLISQTNFWLSVRRSRSQNHDIEIGGKLMCILGFVLICVDSYLLDTDTIPPHAFHYINPLLYHRKVWQRIIIGNTIPFIASSILAQISKVNADLRSIFPPYLNSFIVSTFVSLNMLMVSYFIDGTQIDFHSRWGWFGLFGNGKFMGFFYMSTMLSLGVFISSILISKLFEPIVPATSALFEPILTSILCEVAKVQYFPSAITCFGYVFLLPGQFIIILGQTMLKKQQEAEAQKQQELQAIRSEHNSHQEQKQKNH